LEPMPGKAVKAFHDNGSGILDESGFDIRSVVDLPLAPNSGVTDGARRGIMIKTRVKRGRPDRRGTALMAMVLCVMGMAAMSMALVAVSLGDSKEQRGEKEKLRAAYVSQAGLSQAMYQLQRGLSGNVGSPQTPVNWGGSQCWVQEFYVTPSI